ncbi:RNA polymerase sigma factor [Alloalcanivorax xenomutans]|uniref:RNA polymerase sigma factor n=1 Tax=Alloalcanivorax xenomutans TaxID=1094342 RepID=UPI003BAB31CF
MSSSAANPYECLFELSDIGLVERARHGDSAAFELIIRRHNQPLFRAAIGVLNDEDLAREAMQEAYLNAFTNLDSFQGRASLKTWLTRIVINQAISSKRRQRPEMSLNHEITHLHGESNERDPMGSHMVNVSNPETEVSRQQLRQLLEEAIRALPEIYRCVFLLREVEGLSSADSALCLDISEVLVKKRLSRAREMLRQRLLRTMEVLEPDIFEFAGKRCDVMTAAVMEELARRQRTGKS